MKTNTLRALICFLSNCFMLLSCTDQTANMLAEEPPKDIAGSWKVVQLVRNGEDLTPRMDLADYRLELKEDGTYSLGERLPFALEGSGTYRLNDPQYPFTLLMASEEDPTEISVRFQYPVLRGKRRLSLSFSLDCSGNSYQYHFERENEKP